MAAVKMPEAMTRADHMAPAVGTAHQISAETVSSDVEKSQTAMGRNKFELNDEAGVANIKAAQSVWGRTGFYWVCFGYVAFLSSRQ